MGEHLVQEEAPGVKFGKYTIYRKLAMGGMAELYLARQTGLGNFERTVVLKCILPHLANEEQFVTMFLDEARVASLLNHPNIVQIYEIGEVEGVYYIAMEYIRGPNLKAFRKRLYQRNPRPHYGLLCGVTSQIAAGLHCAHMARDDRGKALEIVHRDVSPTNLLMSYTGAVKLVDFGVAKASIQEHKTRAGMVKGKYRYMSPEQVLAKPIDQRSDIYALGAILYELVTNVVVFGRRSEAETIRAVYIDPIMPPTDMVDGFPPELNRIIMRALARDRNERYDTAEQMRRDMEQFMQAGGRYFGTQEIADTLKGLFSEEVEFERSGLMGSALSRADYIRFASEPAASVLAPLPTGQHSHTSQPSHPYPQGMAESSNPLIPMKRGSGPSQPSHPSRPSQQHPPRGTPPPSMLFPAGIGAAVPIDSQAAGGDGETDPSYLVDDDKTYAIDNDQTFFSNEGPGFLLQLDKSATSPTPARQSPQGSRNVGLLVLLVAALVLGCGAYILWSWQGATKAPDPAKKKHAAGATFGSAVEAIEQLLDQGKHIAAVAAMPSLRAQARTPAQHATLKRLAQHIRCAPTIKTAHGFLSAGDPGPAHKMMTRLQQTCPSMPALKRLQAALAKAAKSPPPSIEPQPVRALPTPPAARKRWRRRRRRRRGYRRPRPLPRVAYRMAPRPLPRQVVPARPTRRRVRMGQLYIRAPGGAKVELDGRLFGFAPINGKALPTGAHRLRVSLAGYTTINRTIQVRTKGHTVVSVPLRKLPTPTIPRPIPTKTTRTTPRRSFSAVKLPRKTVLRLYISDPRGMIGRSYTSQHRTLCQRIENELKRLMGPHFPTQGITRAWLRFVRERGRRASHDRFTAYPRAVAYVAYTQLKRGRSRNRVAQIIVNNERRKRWRRYRNK